MHADSGRSALNVGFVRSGLRARAVSVEYTLSLGVGSAVVPLIAGMHQIGLGFDIQFLGLSASAFVVLTAAWFLPGSQGGNEDITRRATFKGIPDGQDGRTAHCEHIL